MPGSGEGVQFVALPLHPASSIPNPPTCFWPHTVLMYTCQNDCPGCRRDRDVKPDSRPEPVTVVRGSSESVVVRGSPDPARLETFGPPSGSVGRPATTASASRRDAATCGGVVEFSAMYNCTPQGRIASATRDSSSKYSCVSKRCPVTGIAFFHW